MVDIEFIRKKHFVEGWSIRKVAHNLGISRQSVRKVLASAEIPHYKLTEPRPCPVMDHYRGVIKAWLDNDKEAPPKQRHTAKRMSTSVGHSHMGVYDCRVITLQDSESRLPKIETPVVLIFHER